jgi:hypothetical protein
VNFKNEIQNGLHLFPCERKRWIRCREPYSAWFRFIPAKDDGAGDMSGGELLIVGRKSGPTASFI